MAGRRRQHRLGSNGWDPRQRRLHRQRRGGPGNVVHDRAAHGRTLSRL